VGVNAANVFLEQNLHQVNGEDCQNRAQNLATASSCKNQPKKNANCIATHTQGYKSARQQELHDLPSACERQFPSETEKQAFLLQVVCSR